MDQEMRGANWSRLMDTPPCRRCVLYRLMRLRLDDEMGWEGMQNKIRLKDVVVAEWERRGLKCVNAPQHRSPGQKDY